MNKNQKIDNIIKYIKFELEEIFEDEKYINHIWEVDGLIIKNILDMLEDLKESGE